MTFKRFLFWFLILLVETVFVTIVLSSETIKKAAVAERVLLVKTFGEEMAIEIVSQTDVTFREWFYDSGLINGSYAAFVPTQDEVINSKSLKDMGKPVFAVVKEKLQTFWTAVYYGTQRWTIMMMWVPYLIPFVIAVVVDGLSTRKKKQFNFEYASPVVFGAMSHTVLGLAVLPFLYFLVPFPVTPLAAPIWIGAFSVALYSMISHTQQLA